MTDKAAPAANEVKQTDVSLEGDDTFEEFASHGEWVVLERSCWWRQATS